MQAQGQFTHEFKVAALNEAVGNTSSMDMGNIKLGLFSDVPTVGTNGTVSYTEIPGTSGGESTGYARVDVGIYNQSAACKFGSPTYDATTGATVCKNNAEIHFNSVKKSWGAIKGFGLFRSSGTLIAFGTINDEEGNAIENGVTPEVGNIVFFKTGDIVLSMT